MSRKARLTTLKQVSTQVARLLRAGTIGALLLTGLGMGNRTHSQINLLGATAAVAQSAPTVTEDGTTDTSVQPFPGAFLVTGGSVRGRSLLHSFETFSPDTSFTRFDLTSLTDGGDIDNIFSRVSGATPTNLNGPLQVLGGNVPNFFLLNPNGVVFGPGFATDIPGSFFVSTAESIQFDNDTAFAASDASLPNLLTVSVPVGLQFGQNAAPITVNGRFLSGQILGSGVDRSERYTFRPDTTVALVGSGIDISNTYFRTDPGNVRLGSVGGGAYVSIGADTYELSYAAGTPLKDITLTESVIDVDGVSDGNVQMTGDRVWLNQTNILSATESAENGGLVSINAEQVRLTDSTIRSLIYDERDNTRATAETKGGSIEITAAGSFVSEGESQLLTNTFNTGNGGDITINATDISFLGKPDTGGAPRFGNLVSANAYREGQGGDITLIADNLLANGSTLISSSTNSSVFPQVQTGKGGNVRIEVGQLTLQEVAQIGTGTFGNGDSGDLTVVATRGVDVSGAYQPDGSAPIPAGLFASAERGSTGQGGSLLVETPQLLVSKGGKLSTGTAGSGNAGSLTVRAGEIMVSDPVVDRNGSVSGIVATVSPLGSGNGGTLNIESDRITLRNGGQIAASTDGAGNAGSVNIQSDVIDLGGTSADGLFSSSISSRASTAFDAGSVNLTGDRIDIRDQGTVSVSSLAGGSAGNVSLVANSVSLNNGSIQAEANAGSQGNISIESRDVLLMREGSRLTTNATETATGGNISINAPLIVAAENSDISANAVEGDGGNIQLVTQGLVGLAFRDVPTAESDITATSELGVNGTVNIESPNVDTDSGLVQLPENVGDASNQVVAGCAAQEGNQFTSTGRGGLPNSPLAHLSSNRLWQDVRTVGTLPGSSESDKAVGTSSAQSLDSTSQTAAEEITEAGQWYLTSAGEVELLAARTIESNEHNCLTQETTKTASSMSSNS